MIITRLAGPALVGAELAGAALAAALLTGCSAPGGTGTPALSSAAAAPLTAATPGPPLSIKQAGLLFVQIIGALNGAIGAFQADATDQVPLSQFRADGGALIAAVYVSERQLAAERWPAQVQPYITSMMTTYEPAGDRLHPGADQRRVIRRGTQCLLHKPAVRRREPE
jgi:hypothetical protein